MYFAADGAQVNKNSLTHLVQQIGKKSCLSSLLVDKLTKLSSRPLAVGHCSSHLGLLSYTAYFVQIPYRDVTYLNERFKVYLPAQFF